LWIGAAGAALGLNAVRHLGIALVRHSASNALLASAATVVTLLVWTNLMTRIVLCAAAWTAEGPGSVDP
jgi:membrane protein